ncbi:ABC transporter ATP-binding protein [Anaerolinea thermophila]|uniref:Tungstate ABC transporter ATP-binding protein n=1 Tax=Anaerolinea thermophila (strain DSM 14523 / JCM 11388 / NBRC 100420 / UNI-1) TaxID=926569 RepID=E8N2X5_ANATU|nr:phosphate ABC transporter ATP-binding protein [Anaerolinea thermophila]BAJ65125.1 tungstate ABC transporter ATP-binding protein [Anaerolinea thermophila UNI-1]
METLYRIEHLQQTYQNRTVLDVPDLSIRKGEILAVIGPSGSGKSTLLRLLAFLETPTRGQILFDNFPFTPLTAEMPLALRRRVTLVFQRPVLFNASVRANVAYGVRLRGEHNHHQRVEQSLREVGMEKMVHVRAHTLSGGEIQRTALARAIVLQPEVLLLDEPTANLDPYNVRLIEELIQRLNRQQGMTLVVVTHNVFQARRLAHRTALLLEGKLIEVAETPSFFEHPADSRTRAFIQGEWIC